MKFSWKQYILALIFTFVSFLGVRAQEEVQDGAYFPVYEIELLNEVTVDEDLVFPLVYNGYIYTFSLKQKLPIWRLFIGGDIISPWIVKDDLIYFHDIYNRVYAVEIKSGTILWQLTIENEI